MKCSVGQGEKRLLHLFREVFAEILAASSHETIRLLTMGEVSAESVSLVTNSFKNFLASASITYSGFLVDRYVDHSGGVMAARSTRAKVAIGFESRFFSSAVRL